MMRIVTLELAAAAKRIRADLRREVPGVKCRVRIQRCTRRSIDIRYAPGVTREEIECAIDAYGRWEWDGYYEHDRYRHGKPQRCGDELLIYDIVASVWVSPLPTLDEPSARDILAATAAA